MPCLVIAAALSQLMRVDVNEPSVCFIVKVCPRLREPNSKSQGRADA